MDLFLQGTSADGSDTISGGVGGDEVSYVRRRRNVRADLQGDADDGERGERDRIGTDVETLTGGRGRDRLTGNEVANQIFGGSGTDILKGGRGDDELAAQLDLFEPGRQRSRDRLDGGPGSDTVGASADSNRITGGRGAGAIYADRGNDRISERDGQIDRRAPIKEGSRTLGSRRFSIRRRRKGTVGIELPADRVPRLKLGTTNVTVIVRSLDPRRRIRSVAATLLLPAF